MLGSERMHLKGKKTDVMRSLIGKVNMYGRWTTNEKLNDFKLNVLNQMNNILCQKQIAVFRTISCSYSLLCHQIINVLRRSKMN